MEDILIMEYLKKKGLIKEENPNKIHFDYSSPSKSNSDIYTEFFNNFSKVTKNMNPSEKNNFVDRLKYYDNTTCTHFNEENAKQIVSKMWHIDEHGNKHMGEMMTLELAKDIHKRYSDYLSNDITCYDIYVAINSNYHDFYCLFKKWFNDNIELPIIESTIAFWFKDNDYVGSKVWDYLQK